MTAADIPAGMRLKKEAGWNQTERDWAMILNASQRGCYVAVLDGAVVGTITTLSYGCLFSWLGMLLVASEYRRQGIGAKLLNAAINSAKDYGDGAICLDATPAAAPLYRSLGFVDTGTVIRMERPGNPMKVGTSSAHALANACALKAIHTYDEPLFGADRSGILTSLYHGAPHYAWFTSAHPDDPASITGYCLGRSGSQFAHLGPIVADTEEDAQMLLSTALRDCTQQSVIVDAPIGDVPIGDAPIGDAPIGDAPIGDAPIGFAAAAHPRWMGWLEAQGFLKRRTFTRMVLASHRTFGKPDQVYAIAGPELG